MHKYFLVVVISLLSVSSLFSQNTDNTTRSKKRVEADSLFSAKQYNQALDAYNLLLDQFPRDKEIKYALGVCNLYGVHKFERAQELLYDASTGEVPNLVYFYLAETYRYTYQFDKAMEYYRRFMVNGASNEVGTSVVETLVNYCENGNYITKYIYQPKILDIQKVALSEVHQFYSAAPKNGNFTYVPENILTDMDKKMGHRPLMFYPDDPKVGDFVYFSSYGKTDSYGKDIYRIQLLSGGLWSKPEPIGDAINTKFDDDFPYMAPDGVSLYFASKGHYGMGGYDIYLSVYDEISKQWGAPENLGFPYSSPFDDFLFVPGEVDSIVTFATGRNIFVDSVQVVLLTANPEQVRHSAESSKQIAEYSALKILTPAVKSAVKQPKVEVKKTQDEPSKPQKSASFRAVENDPEYSRAIAKGFEEQMKADSLRIKLEKLREKFDYVETAEQRVKLEKQVYTIEEAMLEAQKQADLMFVRASQIEQEYLTGKRKPAGKVESSFAADNPDYIYQAQFATTVFQDNEIAKLEQAEKLYSDIVKLRDKALELRKNYEDCVEQNGDEAQVNCGNQHNSMRAAMKQYSASIAKYYEQKYPIYNECIHVAIIKSGSASDQIREVTNSATTHFRAASTIMNNLTDEGKVESTFEASLLRELGLLRMDYAFAKVWGMELMVKKIAERVINLDVALYGFSKIQLEETKIEQPQIIEDEIVDAPQIERVESTSEVMKITIKSDIPTDFGIVDTMVYSAANPIPVIKTQPAGVIYRIQIGAYGTPRSPSFFKNMVPVSSMRAGKVNKYYIGCFTKHADAEKALQTVKTRGFKDAFIVAWYNGKTVGVTRAKEMENEPVEEQTTTNSAKEQTNNQTSESSSQIFVVQIGVYSGAMPESDLKTVKTLVSGKEISRKIDAQGLYVYSVGSFNTASEAEKIKDNLVASGLLKAMVVTIDL